MSFINNINNTILWNPMKLASSGYSLENKEQEGEKAGIISRLANAIFAALLSPLSLPLALLSHIFTAINAEKKESPAKEEVQAPSLQDMLAEVKAERRNAANLRTTTQLADESKSYASTAKQLKEKEKVKSEKGIFAILFG